MIHPGLEMAEPSALASVVLELVRIECQRNNFYLSAVAVVTSAIAVAEAAAASLMKI